MTGTVSGSSTIFNLGTSTVLFCNEILVNLSSQVSAEYLCRRNRASITVDIKDDTSAR